MPSATPTQAPTPTPTLGPPPLVVASYPVERDRAVAPDRPLTIIFDQAMDPASVASSLTISPALPVSLTWPAPERLSVLPQEQWPAAGWIEVTLAAGAQAVAGGLLERPITWRLQTNGPGAHVPILMYHHLVELGVDATAGQRTWSVSPDAFASQMALLIAEGWATISPAQLVAYLEQGEPLPPRSIMITMDDGYKDVYDVAFSILRDTALRPVLFIVPEYMGYKAYLDWPQLRELCDAGFVVGAHGYDHSNLRQATDDEVLRQVADARALLEEQLGVTVDAFCYPYGSYDARTLKALREHDYRSGYTLNPTAYQVPSETLRLNRLAVTYDMTLDDFAALLR
jgi:peptidoglycan/xylan/chitin deacetylase (PgdA/CDA1 family)